jgi:hypothetical protein
MKKFIWIIGDLDNQLPDKWIYTIFLCLERDTNNIIGGDERNI